MSDFLDRFGIVAEAVIDNAVDKAAEFGSKAAVYADNAVQKGKDKANELKLEAQLRAAFTELGEKYYEQAVNGDEFEKDELVNEITSIKQTLADLAAKK